MATVDERLAALEGNLSNVQANLAASKANYDEALDTIWMLLAAFLVFFMHAGFSLLEAGSVRFKNAHNILAKNLVVVTVGFLCWYAFGWAFAHGALEDANKFSGGTQFFADGFMDDKSLFREWLFQGAFCATAGTIVSGAMAERTQLQGFTIYAMIMTSLIYPFVVYWGWSGTGFLYYSENGKERSLFGPAYIDSAGSGIVHLVGGVGALVGAAFVGPRRGRFDPDVDQREFVPHSIPFIVLGTFCLWFGWYGFNPGSTLELHTADKAYTAGFVAVNTTISPCVAGLVVFFLRSSVLSPKLLDVAGFCNGILAGLVAITAGCAVVKPWETLIIGAMAGVIYQATSMLMVKLKVDDVVDAFAVHGANGIWGVFAVGLFGNPDEGMGGNGLFYGGDQLRTQVCALLIIIVWVGVLSILIFLPMKKFNMLRLSDDFHEKGDLVEQSPRRSYANEASANTVSKHESKV